MISKKISNTMNYLIICINKIQSESFFLPVSVLQTRFFGRNSSKSIFFLICTYFYREIPMYGKCGKFSSGNSPRYILHP
jgi:hypothetical protein